MNTKTPTPPSRFPFFRRCRRFLFSRKMLYAVIILITLLALFHAEENFRAKRAWDRYRQETEARGANLNFAAHIPRPVPDGENAANIPWVRSWFPKPQYKAEDDVFWPDLKAKAEKRIGSRKPDGKRHLMDLVAWKEAFEEERVSGGKKSSSKITEHERDATERAAAAAAVLETLKIYQPTLDEFRIAALKPQVRYPVDYKLDRPFDILLPHLAKIKGVVSVLALQSSAELAADKTEEAFKDVQLMLWFTESLREEPFLINQLVRVACLKITVHIIWEGLAQHKWTEAQLQTLQSRLAQINVVASLEMSMGAERAGAVSTIEQIRKRADHSLDAFTDSGSADRINAALKYLTLLIPRGWFYFEQVNLCRDMDTQLLEAVDSPKKIIHADLISANNQRLKKDVARGLSRYWRHRVFAQLLLPALQNAARAFGSGQVTAHEAALACALERHRLATGSLPETLEALAPKFISPIPHDPLTGEALKYERAGENEFVISSVGWPDLKPEDGETGGRKLKQNDWVWRSAP